MGFFERGVKFDKFCGNGGWSMKNTHAQREVFSDNICNSCYIYATSFNNIKISKE